MVGESGSGKSTLGRSIVGLIDTIAGDFFFDGQQYDPLNMSMLRQKIQIIFQDPLSSLNPRLKIKTALKEIIKLYNPDQNQSGILDDLLRKIDLPKKAAEKYPHELSGGQRQRACIGRVLAVQPNVLICDEIVSALDVSVQAKILNLLMKFVKETQLGILFTTHDLHLAKSFADDVLVMKNGKIVEHGPIQKIFDEPQNSYTMELLQANPKKL